MATYKKRGKTWRAEIRLKGQPRMSKTFATKSDAKLWVGETEASMLKGKRHSSSTQTLTWLIDEYKKARDLSKYEIKMLKWWDDRLGDTRISHLHKDDFTEARRELLKNKNRAGKPIAPATVNRRLASISAVMTFGMDEYSRIVETNPARLRGLPENNAHDPLEDFPDTARAALMKACKEHEEPALYALVRTAMITGARAGELQALRWDDVDMDAGTIRLSKNATRAHGTKNGETRIVPLAGEALIVLKERKRTLRRIDNDLVFYNQHTGGKYNYAPHWTAAKKKAGVKKLRFHDLRHLAASELAMAGVPLMQIGAVLGHKSAAMTKRYSHYSAEAIQGLGDVLADRIG